MNDPPEVWVKCMLLSQGIITLIPEKKRSHVFYSNLFMVPKPNRDVHLDLKGFNIFLKVQKFRMESTQLVIALLHQRDSLASAHIKDVYLHIQIFQPHQRFLQFTVEDRHCQFCAVGFRPGP